MDALKIQAYENLGYMTKHEADEKLEEIGENRLGHPIEELISNCCGAEVENGYCTDCWEPCEEVEYES